MQYLAKFYDGMTFYINGDEYEVCGFTVQPHKHLGSKKQLTISLEIFSNDGDMVTMEIRGAINSDDLGPLVALLNKNN